MAVLQSPTMPIRASPMLGPSAAPAVRVASASPMLAPSRSPLLGAMRSPLLGVMPSPLLRQAAAPAVQRSPLLQPRGTPVLVASRVIVQPSPRLGPFVPASATSPSVGAVVVSPGQRLLASSSPGQRLLVSSSPGQRTLIPGVTKFAASPSTAPVYRPAAAGQDDDFILPAPAVDLEDGADGQAAGAGWPKEDEDDEEYDADEMDLEEDERLVRSPCGTRYVKVDKRFALDSSYNIWFEAPQALRRRGHVQRADQFEENLQCVGTFSTVQEFWRYWNAIDLQKLGAFCSLSVFRKPIKPMWEDDHNKNGGQWILRCSDRDQSMDFFNKLALSLIGGYFECHERLCGVVLTVKPKFNILSLWTKKMETGAYIPVDMELRELLGFDFEDDDSVVLEWKEHEKAVKVIEAKQHGKAAPVVMGMGMSPGGKLTATAGVSLGTPVKWKVVPAAGGSGQPPRKAATTTVVTGGYAANGYGAYYPAGGADVYAGGAAYGVASAAGAAGVAAGSAAHYYAGAAETYTYAPADANAYGAYMYG